MRIFSLYLQKEYFMPRRQRIRKIMAPPHFRGYKPYGCKRQNYSPVELLYEEYEAIKLADYKMLNHQEASVLMGVSRATFARIYENARRKIALALVETREITTTTGNSISEKSWYYCGKCHARFTIKASKDKNQCPLCKNKDIEPLTKSQEE